ncbi:RuvB ATP-dependent DNA helicase pontin [Glugoides intestinalis]
MKQKRTKSSETGLEPAISALGELRLTIRPLGLIFDSLISMLDAQTGQIFYLDPQRMEEIQTVDRDLIHVDMEMPVLKSNGRSLDALQEFISNKNIRTLCVESEHGILSRAMCEIAKKTAKCPISVVESCIVTDITACIRKNVFISIRATRDVYEGEVLEMKHVKDEEGQLLWIEMTLRTAKASKQITLSKNLAAAISGVNIGDVMYVEPNVGLVKRLGRSETQVDEYDLEGDRYVQLTKSAVHNVKEKDIVLSLHDLDYAFNRYCDDITLFTRTRVDEIVNSYITMGIGKYTESILWLMQAEKLSAADMSVLCQLSDQFTSLKIAACVASRVSHPLFNDFFFITKMSECENVVDLIEYFLKRKLGNELRSVISEIATFNNYSSVLEVLKFSNTAQEFASFYNMHTATK